MMVNSDVKVFSSDSKTKAEDMGEITYTVSRGQVIASETHSNIGFAEVQAQ